mgnify:CR=1 FL=1
MLVRSYALDALETADRPPSVPKREDAKEIIDQLASANITHYQALGLGQEVRVNSPTVIAGGLIVGDTVVHLAAFGKQPAVSASRFGNRQMMSARVRRAGWNHE